MFFYHHTSLSSLNAHYAAQYEIPDRNHMLELQESVLTTSESYEEEQYIGMYIHLYVCICFGLVFCPHSVVHRS